MITLDLEEYKSTLAETSMTSYGQEFFSNASIPVYNFDRLKNDLMKQLGIGMMCSSCDALYIGADKNILIEFKKTSYRKLANIENNEQCLKRKLFDSKSILLLLREEKLLNTCKDEVFVVFEKGSPRAGSPETGLPETGLPGKGRRIADDEVIENSANVSLRFKRLTSIDSNNRLISAEQILFGLAKMNGALYYAIHTCDMAEFKRKFIRKYS